MSKLHNHLQHRYALSGQIALVSGASGTLGYTIAAELCHLGATVYALYHTNRTRIEELQAESALSEGSIIPYQVDLNSPDDIKTLMECITDQQSKLDILVACSGQKSRGAFLFGKPETDKQLVESNILSVLNLCRSGLRKMLRNKYGRIILIGSYATKNGMAGQVSYAASKSTLCSFGAGLAYELAGSGININVVSPGAIDNPLDSMYDEEDVKKVTELIACRRLGKIEEVASTVSFLCSSAANYINGTNIQVDGGARF